MQSETRRSLDGLLAIGPHRLDAQLRALTTYADRTEHTLGVLWAVLPGRDPAAEAPDSGFPIVAFDDEIAGFTPEECNSATEAEDPPGIATTDWHVAHATPQPKNPTTHLPVYGLAEHGETTADAILCVGPESLDRQVARIEAYALRSAIRLRGVYVARDQNSLRTLLRDFRVSNKALGTSGPTLTVGPLGNVQVQD